MSDVLNRKQYLKKNPTESIYVGHRINDSMASIRNQKQLNVNNPKTSYV
jgi:lipid A disaccharide synthetase